jgi:hypothetical protein
MGMTLPIILFAAAALGGLTLAILRFRDKPLPTPLALGHGAIAAAGLVTLALVAVPHGAPSLARVALGLFGVAALGGFALFSFQLRKQKLPIGIVVVHGLVAVTAFVILLVGASRT